jgi:hypothetical protein
MIFKINDPETKFGRFNVNLSNLGANGFKRVCGHLPSLLAALDFP